MTEALTLVYEQLGVLSARDIWIAENSPVKMGAQTYIAYTGEKQAIVDRLLAIQMRADGAAWAGDVVRDPCAVA